MRGLICKDKVNGTLISAQQLSETDNIKYEIIDGFPEMVQKEGYYGVYVLNSDGGIDIEYREKPKTDLDKLKQENEDLTTRVCAMQETISQLSDMLMG